MQKEFFPAQNQIKKELEQFYNNVRFVNQIVTKNNIFEMYLIIEKGNPFTVLYHLHYCEFTYEVTILKYKSFEYKK